jgi:hypothetical protein
MRKRLLFIPLAIIAFPLFIALGGEIVKFLWNAVLPPVLGLKAITFWQAVGILALSRILFGRLGVGGCGPGYGYRRRMAERWDAMTPEERERFREKSRGRWGWVPPDPGAAPPTDVR